MNERLLKYKKEVVMSSMIVSSHDTHMEGFEELFKALSNLQIRDVEMAELRTFSLQKDYEVNKWQEKIKEMSILLRK